MTYSQQNTADLKDLSLENRNFRLFWLAEGVSIYGNATTGLALPLFAISELHANSVALGFITAATWLPWLILGLPAGAWVDRLPPRQVMITANIFSALAVLSLPVAWKLGLLTLVQVVLVALLLGISTMFFRTAYAKFIPTLVRQQRLEWANSRLYGTESAMQLLGQGTAGYLIQWLGNGLNFLVNIGTFVVSIICLSTLRIPNNIEKQPKVTVRRSLWRDILSGLHFVGRNMLLRNFMLIGAVSNFGLTGYGTLLVLYLTKDLKLTSAEVGTALMLSSLGGLLGAPLAPILARRLGTGRASTVLFLCSGIPALLIGLPIMKNQLPITIAGGFLLGIAVVAGNVIRSSWRQRYVPHDLLGRVTTTGSTLNFGLMPIGALVAGLLGVYLGVRSTIILMTGIHFLACFSVLLTPLAALKELPEQQAPNAHS